MTKKELLELNSTLIALANFGKTKFKYIMLKNIEILKSHTTILLELEDSAKKYLSEFEKDRNSLIVKIGKQKGDGTVYIDSADSEMISLFNAGINTLIETHKKQFELYDEKIKEYKEILEEEVDEVYSFKSVSIDHLPEEEVSLNQLSILEKYRIITE